MADLAEDAVLDIVPELEELDADSDQLLVIEGEEDVSPASSERDTGLVKHLRDTIREQRKLLANAAPAVQQEEVIGAKPTIESCDYDPEAYATKLDAWHAESAKVERVKAERDAAGRTDLEKYNAAKAKLKLPDLDDAEDMVRSTLNQTQQAVLLRYSTNSALVVAALGRSPGRLAELAKIVDPIEMALFVRSLEGKLKVDTVRKAPAPERFVRGNAAASVRPDKHLERLEAEADKTGDRSKVIAYRRSQRA